MKKIINYLFQLTVVAFSLVFTACTSGYGTQDAEAVTINFDDILSYAERAKAAYEKPEVIKKKYPKTVSVVSLPKTDIQYFIETFHDEKLHIISIRGTSNLKNFKQDAEYIPTKNKKLGIYVHKGFDRDTAKILDDILPRLNKNYAVKVTGHSLGAAIASLLMINLHEEGFTIKHSVNFGQPKFTNKKGAQKYQFLPMLRVVNENDLVPLVPPVTLLDSTHGRYTHFKSEVILLQGNKYVYLNEHDASRTLPGSFWLNIEHASVENHFMDNYLKDIKNKLLNAVQVPYKDRENYIKN